MLMEKIRTDMITARKGSDTVARNLLITLYSEAQAVGKNKRNGDTTDEEVVSVVKKFKANLEETVQLLTARTQDVTAQQHEIQILDNYMPRQMTESELRSAVEQIVSDLGVSGAKSMGQVMAELKTRHAGTYDGKQASQVVKSVLA